MHGSRLCFQESRLIYARCESSIVRVRATNKRRRHMPPLSRRTIAGRSAQRQLKRETLSDDLNLSVSASHVFVY